MTNDEYKIIIDGWTNKVNDLDIKLSNGKVIPHTFWKTFLGITYTVHIEIMNGTYRRKTFSPNLIRAVELTNLLDEETFTNEVKRMIPLFEKNKFK